MGANRVDQHRRGRPGRVRRGPGQPHPASATGGRLPRHRHLRPGRRRCRARPGSSPSGLARRIRDGSAEADHSLVVTFTRKAAQQLRQRLGAFGVGVAIHSTTGAAPGPGCEPAPSISWPSLCSGAMPSTGASPRPTWPTTGSGWSSDIVGDPMQVPVVTARDRVGQVTLPHPGDLRAGRHHRRPLPLGSRRPGRRSLPRLPRGTRPPARHRSRRPGGGRPPDLIFGDAGFAEGVHWRYRHLSVDEFQDINPAQLPAHRGR